MKYKFEKLEVWKLSISFNDLVYQIAGYLPDSERFNLTSQMQRAATSISLNIAEGSTGQSDAEQARFLGITIRSYIEVIACLRLIECRKYSVDQQLMKHSESVGDKLFGKLQAFQKALR